MLDRYRRRDRLCIGRSRTTIAKIARFRWRIRVPGCGTEGRHALIFLDVDIRARSRITSFKANAETWPTKTLTAIVPFAAGSFTDVVPRVVFEQLSKQLGQSIIVENRPGAGTTTAAAYVSPSQSPTATPSS